MTRILNRGTLSSSSIGLCLVLGVLFAGCSDSKKQPASRQSVYAIQESEPGYGGPAEPQPGYDWALLRGPDQYRLIYGRQDGSDTPLALTCAPDSDQVHIQVSHKNSHPQGANADILLATPDLGASFTAQTTRDTDAQTSVQRGLAAVDDPIFSSFRNSGWIAMDTAHGWQPLVAQSGTFVEVGAFLSFCD